MKNRYKITISGTIKELPLTDILQLLGATHKTGILKIKFEQDTGYIFFKQGVINHAFLENYEQSPQDVLYTLISLREGEFEFRQYETIEFKDTINLPVPFVLMEAAKREDEFSIDIDIEF